MIFKIHWQPPPKVVHNCSIILKKYKYADIPNQVLSVQKQFIGFVIAIYLASIPQIALLAMVFFLKSSTDPLDLIIAFIHYRS